MKIENWLKLSTLMVWTMLVIYYIYKFVEGA